MSMMTGAQGCAEGDQQGPVTISAQRHAEGGAARVVLQRRDDGRLALLVSSGPERAGCVLTPGAAQQVADAAGRAAGDELPEVMPGRGPRHWAGRPVMPAAVHATWCGFRHSLAEPLTQLAQLADCAGCGALVEYRATSRGAA